MTTAVLTPFTGKPAHQTGNRLWRKLLLPVGEINYKGRVIKFTREYLNGLAQSFRAGAYDQVPFQAAPDDNSHSNDVERFRGDVTDMTVESDGLWITMQPTERGEQILQDNPRLGVSARIVEDYDRADGKYFPAAIQHVLGTLDPRVTGMGGWQAVEASNDGEITINLSSCSWAGELAFEFSGYDVPGETVAETAMVDQVLAEVAEMTGEAEAYGVSLQEYEDMIAGGQELANQYDRAIGLAGGDSPVSTIDGMTCAACGLNNTPDALYCTNCGTELADPASYRVPSHADSGTSHPALANGAAAISLASNHDAVLEMAGVPASVQRTLAGSTMAIELAGGGGLTDIDRRMTELHAQGRRYWAEEAARPRTASAEVRLGRAMERITAGTYTPGAMVAFSNSTNREVLLSNLRDSQLDFSAPELWDGATAGGQPCGHLDAYGRCGASYHEASCSSLAVVPASCSSLSDTPDEKVYSYLDELRLVAVLPASEQSDATYSDHIEALTGQRQSHEGYDIFETGAPHRELISIGKRRVDGDPDADTDDERAWYGPASGTRNTVGHYMAQAGLERPHTSRDAMVADRILRRPSGPRHPDYFPVAERPVPRTRPMRQLEDSESLSGSLPVMTRAEGLGRVRGERDLPSWDELLDTRPAAGLDEVRDAVYRQSGLGRPSAGRPVLPRYVDDPELLADVQRSLGLA